MLIWLTDVPVPTLTITNFWGAAPAPRLLIVENSAGRATPVGQASMKLSEPVADATTPRLNATAVTPVEGMVPPPAVATLIDRVPFAARATFGVPAPVRVSNNRFAVV